MASGVLSLPGTLLSVYDCGVLLRGPSGVGKSQLALELVSRGHRLVADDSPEFSADPHALVGRCPHALHAFLLVRGLGVLNLQRLFGDTAVQAAQRLDCIISLSRSPAPLPADPLRADAGSFELVGHTLPEFQVYTEASHSAALRVECLVRQLLLQRQDYDATADFSARQAALLR